MPLTPTSFFIPASPAIPYLLEDKYLKGGYRCVADEAERDSIHVGARKPGMRVFVASNGKTWTVNSGALTTWVEVKNSKARTEHQFSPGSAIPAGGSVDFTVGTGKTAMILKLVASHPDLRIEAHSTPSRADNNPYKFESYSGHLVDDGSSKLEDGTTQYNRRFAFVSNLETTPGVNTYWRVINEGSTSITPTVEITYLPMED